jgi:hypothetical protein
MTISESEGPKKLQALGTAAIPKQHSSRGELKFFAKLSFKKAKNQKNFKLWVLPCHLRSNAVPKA